MKFRDTEYNLAQYLLRPKESGMLMLAHLKCLKAGSNDFDTLTAMQERIISTGIGENEIIPWTDGEFDMKKVRELFVERGLARSNVDFDSKVSTLRLNGDVHKQRLEALLKVRNKLTTIRADHELINPPELT